MEALQLGLGFGAVGSLYIAIILIYLIPVIAAWKLFKKVGIAGWKSLIPVYNQYLIYKISGMSGWWVIPVYATSFFNYWLEQANQVQNWLFILICLCSIFTIIATIMKAIKLPKAFGKGIGYILGMIFVPGITEVILGFGKAEYQGDYKG